MSRIRPDDWKPAGGIVLEPNAEDVVRSDSNCVVVAGPGAGKTELLAQRACYLLETGLCPEPRTILAISFKRDAAKNLADRVQKRCGPDLARRFHSLTYDAFAKGLIDRFRLALPSQYKPSVDYEIVPDARRLEHYVGDLDISLQEYGQVNAQRVVTSLCRSKLPLDEDSTDLHHAVRAKLWMYLTGGRQPSLVTFPMLSRLAELLLRGNPLLLNALRACYSHVFLDEFQDTTEVQYDLVVTAFRGSQCTLTAVGDPKQRIMGWAGALPDVIDRFCRDFAATRRDLLCNYRSVARLVHMQHVLARYLDPTTRPAVSARSELAGEGVCRVLLFSNLAEEARAVSAKIVQLIHDEKVKPRDIAVLARQKVGDYSDHIIPELHKSEIKARIESELQDLLSEPCVNVAMAVLRLACGERDPVSWQMVMNIMTQIRGAHGPEADAIILEGELQDYLDTIHRQIAVREGLESVDGLELLIRRVFEFIGLEGFKACFPQYKQGGYLEKTLRRTAEHLHAYLDTTEDLRAAISDFLGEHTVPIMTIHKSKGLEYDTVFFIGLEDGAFWSYDKQPEEDTCAFFVAFSRAKRRVYFTFSSIRKSGRGGALKRETRERIKTLYDLLEEAGAEIVDLT